MLSQYLTSVVLLDPFGARIPTADDAINIKHINGVIDNGIHKHSITIVFSKGFNEGLGRMHVGLGTFGMKVGHYVETSCSVLSIVLAATIRQCRDRANCLWLDRHGQRGPLHHAQNDLGEASTPSRQATTHSPMANLLSIVPRL